MLFESLDATAEDDVPVLDRGLIGNTIAAAITQRKRHFCMRVDATGYACARKFLRSGKAETIVELDPPRPTDRLDYAPDNKPTCVRLIRDVTPSGAVRVLMTSLLDPQRFPAETFGALYHSRWRVEEAFKRIKHRLHLEAVSGLTYLALQQDFAAKRLADNLHTLLASAHQSATDAPEPADSRPNRTAAFGAFAPILIGCLLRIGKCLVKLEATLDLNHQDTMPHPARAKLPKATKNQAARLLRLQGEVLSSEHWTTSHPRRCSSRCPPGYVTGTCLTVDGGCAASITEPLSSPKPVSRDEIGDEPGISFASARNTMAGKGLASAPDPPNTVR